MMKFPSVGSPDAAWLVRSFKPVTTELDCAIIAVGLAGGKDVGAQVAAVYATIKKINW